MYVYEHVNGMFHFKPDVVVRPIGAITYFDSPNVKEYWHFVSDDEAKKFVEEKKCTSGSD